MLGASPRKNAGIRPTIRVGAALLVVASIGAALPADLARADTLPPIRDDLDRATRLVPAKGALGVVEKVAPEELDPWRHKDEGWVVGGHVRWVSLPDFVLDLFLDDHTGFHSFSAGISAAMPLRRRERLVIELDWTRLAFPAGNWRGPNEAPGEAEYVEADLQHISVDVTWRRYAWVAEWLAFVYGAGGGLAVIAGDARTTEVLPSCEDPVATCPHWREAGKASVSPPSPVIPVVHALVGAHFEVTDQLAFRIEAGFRNVLYLGIWGGWRL